MRKVAGFTQEQLAAELQISRRRIAYYEAESDHPPATLLPELARVLNTTVEELLGSDAPKRKARVSLSPRLERRLKQIEGLSPKSQAAAALDHRHLHRRRAEPARLFLRDSRYSSAHRSTGVRFMSPQAE